MSPPPPAAAAGAVLPNSPAALPSISRSCSDGSSAAGCAAATCAGLSCKPPPAPAPAAAAATAAAAAATPAAGAAGAAFSGAAGRWRLCLVRYFCRGATELGAAGGGAFGVGHPEHHWPRPLQPGPPVTAPWPTLQLQLCRRCCSPPQPQLRSHPRPAHPPRACKWLFTLMTLSSCCAASGPSSSSTALGVALCGPPAASQAGVGCESSGCVRARAEGGGASIEIAAWQLNLSRGIHNAPAQLRRPWPSSHGCGTLRSACSAHPAAPRP